MLIVVPFQDTAGLDFDEDLVEFLNSSKFDVNRIMLLTVDGTPAMFATKKKKVILSCYELRSVFIRCHRWIHQCAPR
jgi:hypothetical protein